MVAVPSRIEPPGLRMVESYSPMGHTMTADKGITDAEFRLIAAIRRHDWRDGICRASQAELAAHCGKDERSVRRLVSALKDKHLLVEENDPARPGRARVYRLIERAATTPQTGQLWPVYDPRDAVQTGQDQPVKVANSGQLNRTNLAGLKKTPVKTPENDDSAASQPGAATDHELMTPTPPMTSKPLLPAPKPTPKPEPTDQRLARVIDLIRAANLQVAVTGRDGAALKACSAAPEEIAACYIAIATGAHGDDYMRRRLAIHYVANDAINGWLIRDKAKRATGYSGSPGGPDDPALLALFDRTMGS
jgi:DNA-binding MarR family transcriptional regulator